MVTENPQSNEQELGEQEMINFLLQNGYIKSIEKYDDPKKVLEIPTDKFPIEIRDYVFYLKRIISMPIMRDDIEEIPGESVTNKKREEIYDKLYKINPKLGVFYKDKNKLQASYLANALHVIDQFNDFKVNRGMSFSDKIKNEFEKLKFEFSGSAETITPFRYKIELNNEQKADLARRITSLAEDAILESVII